LTPDDKESDLMDVWSERSDNSGHKKQGIGVQERLENINNYFYILSYFFPSLFVAILVKMLPYHYLAIKTTPGANHINFFTAYPSEAPEKCSIQGRPLALPANIRLGCKGLPGTNTLGYYLNP
jgi:hypothetical protein